MLNRLQYLYPVYTCDICWKSSSSHYISGTVWNQQREHAYCHLKAPHCTNDHPCTYHLCLKHDDVWSNFSLSRINLIFCTLMSFQTDSKWNSADYTSSSFHHLTFFHDDHNETSLLYVKLTLCLGHVTATCECTALCTVGLVAIKTVANWNKWQSAVQEEQGRGVMYQPALWYDLNQHTQSDILTWALNSP